MLTGIKEEIHYEIEKLVRDFDLTYIDAVLFYCERNGLDEEYVGSILNKNPSLRSKIQIEAEELHFLPKTDRLPL